MTELSFLQEYGLKAVVSCENNTSLTHTIMLTLILVIVMSTFFGYLFSDILSLWFRKIMMKNRY